MPGLRSARWLFLASFALLLGLQALLIGRLKEIHTCPPGQVCIDPANTSCFVFDMSTANWKPVAKDERHHISVLYAMREADYKFQREGVDCYRRDRNFALTDKVISLPVEWWKPRRRQ